MSDSFQPGGKRAEARSLAVTLVTLITMIVEIVAGQLTGSMALLADGWHMGTHALALGLAYAAYRLARHYQGTELFANGTAHFGVLAGYTSALLLGATGIWMLIASAIRFFEPIPIAFGEAMLIALLGLIVNVVCIAILHDTSHDHDHDHGHDHPHEHHRSHEHSHEHDMHGHQDHNYRAAYLHVLADAVTSVCAIGALAGGRQFGWMFLDPLAGMVSAGLILRWSAGLIRTTGYILLSGMPDTKMREARTRQLYNEHHSH